MAQPSTSKLVLETLQIQEQSKGKEFIEFKARMRVPIAPCWSSDGSNKPGSGQGGLEGVKEVLASWIMRYLPPIKGVLLTFDPKPTYAHPTESFNAKASPFRSSGSRSRLLNDNDEEEDEDSDEDEQEDGDKPRRQVQLKVLPMVQGSGFTLAYVNWTGLAWRPQLGQKIIGSPTLSTPSHISLLLHDLFNASIPVTHIDQDLYEFDPDFPVPDAVQKRQRLEFPTAEPIAENLVKEDAEAAGEGEGVEGEAKEEEEENEEEKEARELAHKVEEEEELYRQHGWWLRKDTREPLGGEDGRIEFTIIGLTIANSMISVTGSLLENPFSSKATTTAAESLPNKSKKSSTTITSKAKSLSNKKRAKQLDLEQEKDDQTGAGRYDDDESEGSSRSPSPQPPRNAPPTVQKVTAASSSSTKRELEQEEDGEDARKEKKKAKKERRKSKA